MDAEDAKRLERFEDKLDDIKEKLSAFPVVGQRLEDIERRLTQLEADYHNLLDKVTENQISNAKLLTIASIAAVVGTIALRMGANILGV